MIADTSAWIDFIRATGSVAHLKLKGALQRREPIWMVDTVYQELLQGARNPHDYMRMEEFLDALPSWEPENPREIARHAATLYARCRWQGVTLRSSNDCLIAVCAIEAGQKLLHADRDFDHIASIEPSLRFV